MRNPLADKVVDIKPSGIRKFFDIVSEMQDAISLGVGEPDFDTPWNIRDEGIYSLEKGRTFYTSNAGLKDLRQEICNTIRRKQGVSYDWQHEVLVTVGGSEAIDIGLRAMCNPGDEVLIPDPAYLAYPACVSIAHGVPVLVPTYAKDEFRLTVEELEKKVTPKTKAILIGYPNNPTGTIMDRASLEKVAAFAKAHDLIVIADEIYCDLTYEGQHTCFASLPDMQERTIVLNGFSKSYAMTGLRIGYVCAPREALEEIYKVHQYEILCASTTSQYGAIEALRNCDDDVNAMYEEYAARREMIYQGLVDMGLTVFKPKGAFYIFPDISCTGMDEEEFCDRLLTEEKVGVVPGTCFGPQGKNHIRISYAASRKNIAEALKRMARFVKKYKKA